MKQTIIHSPRTAQLAAIAGLLERKRLQAKAEITVQQRRDTFTITVHCENKLHERLIAEAIRQHAGQTERKNSGREGHHDDKRRGR